MRTLSRHVYARFHNICKNLVHRQVLQVWPPASGKYILLALDVYKRV